MKKQANEIGFHLSPAEKQALNACVTDQIPNPYREFEGFLSFIQHRLDLLPVPLRDAVVSFRERGNLDGALFITGFPAEPSLPQTPSRPETPVEKLSFQSEYFLTAVAALLGEPVGYAQEKSGAILQHLYPVRESAFKQVSGSSAVDLEFHTELAFHPFLPDFVLLFGLRQDPEREARTYFAGVRRILRDLTEQQREILSLPLFRTGVDYSFVADKSQRGKGPLLPVLYGQPEDPYFRYDLDLMSGTTEASEAALRNLQQLVIRHRRFIRIRSGSICILDNRRTVHSRSSFRARYDGSDRWLLRMSVVKSLADSINDRVTGSRVIQTSFENLGDISSMMATESVSKKATTLGELRTARIRKLEKLRLLGVEPYSSGSSRTQMAATILQNYPSNKGLVVTVAGRIMLLRSHGGITFAKLQDESGAIQILLDRDNLTPEVTGNRSISYRDLSLLDVGDFIEAQGEITESLRGETSVRANRIQILTKSLRPLPNKWSGLQDREAVLRHRYLATTMDPSHRANFYRISKTLLAIRQFLDSRGFVECLTPVLQPIYGGGSAKPFKTWVNALNSQFYLAISHELYLKRLIAGGFEKVYTIGRYFRNEGIDRTHQPEFSMLETMAAYQNYQDSMDFIEDLFRFIASEVYGKLEFRHGDNLIDLGPRWRRVAMNDVVREVTGEDFLAVQSVEEAQAALGRLGINSTITTPGQALQEAFEVKVQPSLIAPTIVFGHPVEISPLAKPMAEDPRCAERFELFIGGTEMSENWTEQNDPLSLFARWKGMRSLQDMPLDERQEIDFSFLEMLEYGIPPTTGIGPGIERMAMFFNEVGNIDDVVYFPIVRPRAAYETAAFYGESISDRQESSVGAPSPLVADEFEALLLITPAPESDSRITLTPHLRIWEGGVAKTLRASGYVEIRGLPAVGEVHVAGYQLASTKQESEAELGRQFADIIEHGVMDHLRKRFPHITVVRGEVVVERLGSR